MENDTEVMYAILNLALWIILLAFSVSPLGHFSGYVLLVLSACSYFFIYLHLWLERPLFFTEERAEKIRALTKEARRMMPMRNPEEEQRMRKTFDRAVEKMEKDKVFLDAGMSEAALAHEIGTNRAYLSKAVNVYSGQNFPQFVNSYRIAYSKELINNDRNAKFQDIAAMAGFQSPVAFDVTFKLHTGQTPSEYLTSLSTIEERAP